MLTATLGTLTPEQNIFVDHMSNVVVRESTDTDYTSSDEELDKVGKQKTFMLAARKMISSSGKTNKRLIDIFRV